MTWSVFLGPHVSRHRKSGRHARAFTSHGNDTNVQPNATSFTQVVIDFRVVELAYYVTLRYDVCIYIGVLATMAPIDHKVRVRCDLFISLSMIEMTSGNRYMT